MMLVFHHGLTIEELSKGGRCVLRLHGELDMASARELESILCSRAVTHREVLVELTGLSFMDSMGIRAILAGHAACSARGHRLIATGASPRLRRVLETTGLADSPPFAAHPGSGSWPLSTVQGASRARPRRRPPASPPRLPERPSRPR
jgi:anti-sigma B factor antagonist